MTDTWRFLGWYLMRGGQRTGPYPGKEFTRMVLAGEVRASDEVWKAFADERGPHFFRSSTAVVLGRWQPPATD